MSEQNLKNHGRYVPLWHFITPTVMTAVLIVSIINLLDSAKENIYSASLLVAVSLILWIFWWYGRVFALRAQDRAIRSEENLRHFILTGKSFDSRLRMSQIIALRFASDEELPALAKQAADENLTQKQIKEAVKNWRADHHRA
jgi:hypothetical protein